MVPCIGLATSESVPGEVDIYEVQCIGIISSFSSCFCDSRIGNKIMSGAGGRGGSEEG